MTRLVGKDSSDWQVLLIVALGDDLCTLPEGESLVAILQGFPGGYLANLPGVAPEDWENSVLAPMPGQDHLEPLSPWVQGPPEDDEATIGADGGTAFSRR